MNPKQLAALIGTFVLVASDRLKIACRVTDAKQAYGVPRLEVEPVAGQGRIWVNAARATAVEPPKLDEDLWGAL